MTRLGFEQLEQELDRLKNEERPKVVEAIAVARALGDLKENAEYHAAREQQSFMEGRIEEIENKLSNAQVIDVAKMQNSGKVIFGATVTYKNPESKEKRTVQIVGEDEAIHGENKISILSPIARSLIGKFIKDTATVSTPVQSYQLLIETVELQITFTF